MKKAIVFVVAIWSIVGCSSSSETVENPPAQTPAMYFPPIGSDIWDTTMPQTLNWDATKLPDLLSFLQTKNTKSFIVLVDGKIVLENYFNGQTATQLWYTQA